jgi:RNA polymerase sigma factor for flagellar operon FliA
MSADSRSPQQLIEDHQGLVRSLAFAMRRSLPKNVELDDLVSYGQVGLAEAARDFNPSLGNQFSTYAYYRVRGAMCDGLSKLMWFSRSTYQRMRYQKLADEIVHEDTQNPHENEPHDASGNTQWLSRMTTSLAVVYLATTSGDNEDSGQWNLADKSAVQPSVPIEQQETQAVVREMIDALPDDARQLLRFTYFEGLTLQEAGQRLGLSKSWASRLHAKALESLGRSLRTHGIQSS